MRNGEFILGKVQWNNTGGVSWVKCLVGDADSMSITEPNSDPKVEANAAKGNFSGLGCNVYQRILSGLN